MTKIISSSFFTNKPNIICNTGTTRIITSHSDIISTNELEKINSFTFAGVYQIRSKNNDEVLYIGSALLLSKRLHQIITGIHHDNEASNIKLREHCKKYGIDDLEFTIIEKLEDEGTGIHLELFRREKHHINLLEPTFNSINYKKEGIHNKRYTKDTIQTQIYFNSKILNFFGNPMIMPFSLDYKTGHIKSRPIQEVDEERKNWTSTIVICNDGEEEVRTRGYTGSKVTKIEVIETVVIRKKIF